MLVKALFSLLFNLNWRSGYRVFPVCMLLLAVADPARADDVQRELLRICENIYQSVEESGLDRLSEPDFVLKVYEHTGHRPLWDASTAAQALAALRDSELEGLNPSDYRVAELERSAPAAEAMTTAQRARRDVVLTDAVLRYARHLVEGKVNPRMLDESWNYTRRQYRDNDVPIRLVDAVGRGELTELLASLTPEMGFYDAMKRALASLRSLNSTQAFFEVPDGRTLRRGDADPAIPLLRRRLAQLAYLPSSAVRSDAFDAALEAAVREFQLDHGIDSDGIVGRQSFAALNMSFSQRIDTVRVNMDRLRWISQDVSDEFIVVNIAGYELYYARGGELKWETPVMVGSIDSRTPILQSRLQYLEFNPSWNVPRSIVARNLFAEFSADPVAAESRGYRFYAGNDRAVAASDIDWSAFSGDDFPYRVVQMPGPHNAMGRVKFMFPNRHAVYLHDTPARQLFSRTQRAFSAGCIRVKNPLELAAVLLADSENWGPRQIEALVASGERQRVGRVQRPVDVMLMYWTVSPGGRNGLQFLPDVYGLDPASLAALDRR